MIIVKKNTQMRTLYSKIVYLCNVVILRLTHSVQYVREHFSRFDEKIMVRRVLSLTMRNIPLLLSYITMKKILLIFLLLLITAYSHSQQFVGSGGSGTEDDPFLIENYNDFFEFRSLFYNATQYTRNKYFQQVADIAIESDFWNNPIQGSFYGYFNGKGHTLLLPDTLNNYDNVFYTFFSDSQGIIDSVRVSGNVNYCFGITQSNIGEIRNCETNVNVTIDICPYSEHSFIANNNSGLITDCTNYGNLIAEENEMNFYAGSIAVTNSGTISACKNYGNIAGFLSIGGICVITGGTIHNCINYGDITSPQDLIIDYYDNLPSGGIFAITGGENDANNIPTTESCINYGFIRAGKLYCGGGIMGSDSENTENAGDGSIIIRNCANYGEILSGKIRGGISGSLSSLSNIFSCFNAGQVASATTSGGIVGTVYDTAHISNCLDVSGMHIMIDKWEVTGDSISNMSSNYYDRQMSGGSGEDIEGETEGRLTSQLTGDTPELHAMLGDGWSYAEGRYPIPLGLENDSLAMLFATPIYLYAESEEEYDDVDLVQHHFSVGTENNVSWASGSRLNIVGENATILASGNENVTASLAGYSFTRRLNLINPVIVDEHIFDDVKIFPNPATDILNITSSETIPEIEIVNTLGQVVKRIEVNSDNAVCDVDDLRSGVYVVRIHAASTTLNLRRFVKE